MYTDPTGHKEGQFLYDMYRRYGAPEEYVDRLIRETLENLTWDEYNKKDSYLQGFPTRGDYETAQTNFFRAYVYDPEKDNYTWSSFVQQRGAFEQNLEDSILYNVNRTLENKVKNLVWGTIFEFQKYIGETCYEVYGDLGKTYNNLKSDFAYLKEHPTALFEGVYEIGKDTVTKAYNDFKTQVINGDAKSRAKYFAGALFDLGTTIFAFSKAKTSIDALKSATMTKELMDVAKKEGITGVGNNKLKIEQIPLAKPGEDLYVGTYSKSKYWNKQNGLNDTHTPHHVIQDAVSSISHGRGVTINLRKDIHELTETFKARRDLPDLRQHLAFDVKELRNLLKNFGYDRSTINAQLWELVKQNKATGNFVKPKK
jgi:hypothetical protein